MGMRAYDRIPTMRYDRDCMLPTLKDTGRVCAESLENGFDRYY